MRREADGSIVGARRAHHVGAVSVAALVVALVLFATRDDPLLSPDSISYLSTAQHLRAGAGFVDLTGQPMAVFGPVYPILLLPGGRSLVWASIVGSLAAGTATVLMFALLCRHVRPWTAVVGAAAFGASQGLLRVTATAWSEGPYAAVALAVLVLMSGRLTTRRAAVGGLLAGIGFLTRYAGVGLIATGLVMVLVASFGTGRRAAMRRTSAYLATALVVGAVWIVRNLAETGDALGPRFSGGSPDSVRTLLRRPLIAIGELVMGTGHSTGSIERVGGLVVVGILVALAVVAWRRPWDVADAGVVVFALTSLVVPVVARAVTASDVESRVMSPMVIPIVYLAVRVLDRRDRAVLGVGVALAAWWTFQGVSLAGRFPDLLAGSAGSRSNFSPQLYDLVEALPASATVLTDHTHRMWWHTHHDPVVFAFVRPRAGNSQYPIGPDETLAYTCRADTYLAWVDEPSLEEDGPFLRRPDLAAYVDLEVVRDVPGGALYRVTPRDPGRCP